MAQELQTYFVLHYCSVYIDDVHHSTSCALKAEVERHYSTSCLIYGPEVAERRVVGEISVTESLPDVFYGFQEVSSGVLRIANLDGELNFLLDEDNLNQPVRIRRYDEANQELHEVMSGAIEAIEVGDEVEIRYVSHRLDVFDQELPKNRVYTADALTNPSELDVEVTAVFPDATDINQPIPIVFGEAARVPLQLIKSDSSGYAHHYLVCEGTNVDVGAVYRDGQPTYTETAQATGAGTGSNTIVFASSAKKSAAFYKDLYIEIIQGRGEYQVRLITSYDPATRQATVDENWTSPGVDSTSVYRIREYRVYSGTFDYRRRTVIQFRYPQKQGGQLQRLEADVSRYEGVARNKLVWTEEFAHSVYNSRNGWQREDDENVLVTDNSVVAPDGNKTAATIENTAGTSNYIRQLYDYPTSPGGGTVMLFSVWLKCDASVSPLSVSIFCAGASSLVTVTSSWQRFSVSKTWSSGTWALVGITVPSLTTLYAWGAQFEYPATEVSMYEPVRRAGQGFQWSFPAAIKELLSDIVWGLNLPVSDTSFDTARLDLQDVWLKCKGSIPSIDGGTVRAKEILDSMLLVRGMRPNIVGSLWELEVDKVQTSIGVLGSAETPEDNISDIGTLQHMPVENCVKTVILKYKQDRRSSDDTEVVYAQELQASACGQGLEQVIEANFIRDFGTADRTVQYLAGKHQAISLRRKISIGQAGRAVTPGKMLTLHIPRRMSENYHLYSEDLTQSSVWLNEGLSPHPAVSIIGGRNQYEKSQRLSYVDFPTPNPSTTDGIYQTVAVDTCSGKRVTWTLWMRCAGGTTVFDGRLAMEIAPGTSGTTAQLFPDLGTGWKKCKLTHQFTSGDVGTNFKFLLRTYGSKGTGDVILEIASSQVCFDYEYQYVKTEASSHPVEDEWQVVQISRDGIDKTTLELIPYRPSVVFAFTASDYPADLQGDSTTWNEAEHEPEPPTDVIVPPNGTTNSADAGVEVDENGAVSAWGTFQFTSPPSNCTRVDLQRRLKNSGLWELVSSVALADTEYMTSMSLTGHGFTPGMTYEVELVAVNERGLYTPSTIYEWVPPGDVTAPVVVVKAGDIPNSDRLTVVQGTAKALEVRLYLSGSSEPADLAKVKLYRATGGSNPNFPGEAGLVKEKFAFDFHDIDVSFGTQYWYWARLVDSSGNASSVIGNGNSSQTDLSGNYPRGATTGAALAKVGYLEIGSVDASTITTGALKVAGSAAGATKIIVTDDSFAKIEFQKAADSTVMATILGAAGAFNNYLFINPGTDLDDYLYLGNDTSVRWKKIWGFGDAGHIGGYPYDSSPCLDWDVSAATCRIYAPAGSTGSIYSVGTGKASLMGGSDTYRLELTNASQIQTKGLIQTHFSWTGLDLGIRVTDQNGTLQGWLRLFQN